jgi:hypothetical protein
MEDLPMSDKVEKAVSEIQQQHSVSDLVNQEMSREDQLAFAKTLWAKGTDTATNSGGEFTKQFGELEITFDTDHGSRIVKDIHNKNSGQNLYDTPAEIRKAQAKPETEDKKAKPVIRPGIDDAITLAICQNASSTDKETAHTITEKLLKGKNISEDLNDLPMQEQKVLMSLVKQELLEKSKGQVNIAQDFDSDPNGTRYVSFETEDGARVLITESKLGAPRDVQVNNGLNTWYRAQDLFDRPGDAEKREALEEANRDKRSILEKLAGDKPLSEGSGPMARFLRGDNLSAEEYEQLKKSGLIYEAKAKGAE